MSAKESKTIANDEPLVVFMTAASRDEALRLAESLVGRRLAACVQILPGMTSVYHWRGAVERSAEVLILAKTTRANFAELERIVRAAHSYNVPEIIAVSASEVSAPYLKWLRENVNAPQTDRTGEAND